MRQRHSRSGGGLRLRHRSDEVADGCTGPNGLFNGDGTGCSKTCTKEPICRGTNGTGATHACTPTCGNGNLESGEGCDDGNLVNGDGCSSTCQIEPGFTCATQTNSDTQPCTQTMYSGQCLDLPVKLRDFKSEHETGRSPGFLLRWRDPAIGQRYKHQRRAGSGQSADLQPAILHVRLQRSREEERLDRALLEHGPAEPGRERPPRLRHNPQRRGLKRNTVRLPVHRLEQRHQWWTRSGLHHGQQPAQRSHIRLGHERASAIQGSGASRDQRHHIRPMVD